MTQAAAPGAAALASRNHFSLFDLAPSPALDVDDLAARKRALLSQFHPDRFSDASPTERRMAESLAAEINAAFTTLVEPVRRLGYLLTLAGVDLQSAERQPVSPAFLMQQMELREAVAEWATLTPSQRVAVGNDAEALFDAQWQAFDEYWGQEDVPAATDVWVRLQYVDKLRREILERKQD